jgi:hypothetical protein
MSEDDNAKHFRDRIRQYNSALAFTSFTAKEKTDNVSGEPIQNVNADGGGPWVWKSGYTIYHRVGTLFPDTANNPCYAQLYFYDPDEALDIQMRRNDKLNRDTMKYLEDFLLTSNHYTHVFFRAKEVLDRNPSRDLGIRIIADNSADTRRYNVPVVHEIAIVLPGDQSRAVNPRNIVLHLRDGDLQFIHNHHPAYVPLHYVLLFPFNLGGHMDYPFETGIKNAQKMTTTTYWSLWSTAMRKTSARLCFTPIGFIQEVINFPPDSHTCSCNFTGRC